MTAVAPKTPKASTARKLNATNPATEQKVASLFQMVNNKSNQKERAFAWLNMSIMDKLGRKHKIGSMALNLSVAAHVAMVNAYQLDNDILNTEKLVIDIQVVTNLAAEDIHF